REESIAELALPRRESAGHRIDHALAGQDVALRREVLARDAAGPLDASGSREGRCLAARVHEARVSLLPARIALQDGIESRPRTPAGRAGTPHGTPPDAPACAPLRWPPFRAASRRRAPGPRTPGRGADPGLSACSRLP